MTETKVPTLYIGTYDAEGNGSFQEFPFVSSGEVTPENLIAAMGELTGWDLTLSEDDPVTTGKGGMTVSLSLIHIFPCHRWRRSAGRWASRCPSCCLLYTS